VRHRNSLPRISLVNRLRGWKMTPPRAAGRSHRTLPVQLSSKISRMLSCGILAMAPMSECIGSDRVFSCRFRAVSAAILPRPPGIAPVRLHDARTRTARFRCSTVPCHGRVGHMPVRRLSKSSTASTRFHKNSSESFFQKRRFWVLGKPSFM
jgi:hypothetical protein